MFPYFLSLFNIGVCFHIYYFNISSSKMVKGVGVPSMQKVVSRLNEPYVSNLYSYFFGFRSSNFGLPVDNFQASLTKIQPATESEFSPRTPSLLDLTSGTR